MSREPAGLVASDCAHSGDRVEREAAGVAALGKRQNLTSLVSAEDLPPQEGRSAFVRREGLLRLRRQVEEEFALGLPVDEKGQPELPRDFIRNMRIDTTVGMVATELAQWFIIITTGSVLFSHGITTINTAADAAKALEPLVRSFPNSGQVARDLFAVGIIGLGLLGIPVLAGSAAYSLSEAFGWKEGLWRRFSEAHGFYGVIIISTGIGLLLNFIGIDPIKALIFTAVFNGVAAVPLLFLLGKINSNRHILGTYRGGLMSRTLVWLTFAVMALSAVGLFYTVLVHP